MKRKELVKGEYYAIQDEGCSDIYSARVIDLEPWHRAKWNHVAPGDDGSVGPHILILVEGEGLDLVNESEIKTTWEEHTRVSRWLKAEKDWHKQQFGNKVAATRPAIEEILALGGLSVRQIHWNDSFREISIRLDTSAVLPPPGRPKSELVTESWSNIETPEDYARAHGDV